MCMTWGNVKCVLSTCRLLGWPCDHSQCLGLLQTSKLLEKAADINKVNVPHVRRLQCCQNPCNDGVHEHGKQVWSYDQTARQPFCAQKPTSSVIFRSGHSVHWLAIDSVHYSRWCMVSFILLFHPAFSRSLDVCKRPERWE